MKLSNNSNISSIEAFLYDLLKEKVSENITAGTLPNNINKEWDNMVVIDCENPIVDYDAYSIGTLYIFLYARPTQNGLKNVAKLKELEERLNVAIDTNKNKIYTLERITTQSDFDNNIKWHRNDVELIIKIKN